MSLTRHRKRRHSARRKTRKNISRTRRHSRRSHRIHRRKVFRGGAGNETGDAYRSPDSYSPAGYSPQGVIDPSVMKPPNYIELNTYENAVPLPISSTNTP
jgi:hypothetical protein